MKRKVWVTSPVFYIMAATMLVMAVITYRYNKLLFAVETTCALLILSSFFASDRMLSRKITSSMRNARSILTADDVEALDDFPVAVTVVAEQGDLVWANKSFRDNISKSDVFAGDSIMKYIFPKTLRQIMSEKNASVSYDDKEYTVHGVKSDNSFILYFVDDTYYKKIVKEYKEKYPVICVAAFDNKDEIARGGGSGEESRIVAEVDTAIRNWGIREMGGITRKMATGRYLIITDESHVELAKKKRFEIIDTVREIKNENRVSATVSMGVGRGASDIAVSEEWARQALDMALGRGGDQVAIKNKDDSFEFFGGLSKGVEKRDKVRTRVIAAAISDQCVNSDRIFLMGHKNSDLDCVGACVGMWAVITKGLNKQAEIVINKNTTLAGNLVEKIEEAYPDQKIFISAQEAGQEITKSSTVIIADTHAQNFVESEDLIYKTRRIIVIDHHRMMVNHIKNAQIFYHEPYASSASEMVAELVQYIKGTVIGEAESQAMLGGIMLDTKNFVLKTGARTFEASAFLKRCGADTVQVKRLFADSLETYKEKAQLVSGAEIIENCAIAVSDWQDGDMRIAAAQAADELLSIRGVKASFVIYRNGSDVNISARSLGDVNVQLILEEFGGGGHLTMAGAQIKDTTVKRINERLKKVIKEKIDTVTVKD